MVKADYKDKNLVVEILSQSFDNNKSVNYVIKQDRKRKERIKNLMAYSFEVCYWFGAVYLSNDKSGCALILLPDQKKSSFNSILLDVKLIATSLGLGNIKKTLEREAKIKKLHPNELIYHLWYIGVAPGKQKMRIGSDLLHEVLHKLDKTRRPVYLETSAIKNISWYEKFGFRIYGELDFGFKLFLLKRA